MRRNEAGETRHRRVTEVSGGPGDGVTLILHQVAVRFGPNTHERRVRPLGAVLVRDEPGRAVWFEIEGEPGGRYASRSEAFAELEARADDWRPFD